MAFTRLTISNFRNLSSVQIEPLLTGFNYFFGANGSGKTSLLEAIYYLLLGRSFRSNQVGRIIAYSASKLALFGEICTENDHIIPLGLEKSADSELKLRMGGRNITSVAEVAQFFPIQVMNSNTYALLETPQIRRKYLDWGAFYANPQFVILWRDFQRALKQRNAALRAQLSAKEITIWTQELAKSALLLDQVRNLYVADLIPLFTALLKELLLLDNLTIKYQPGWDSTLNYEDFLGQNIDKDRQAGYTQNGPHRADFKILINNIPAKDILSRGQQKLFVCAMILAQGMLLYKTINKKPIYLVDDLPSELDSASRSKLMSLLSKQNAQVFVTGIDQQVLEEFLSPTPTKMFHVEHGKVEEAARVLI